MSDSTEIFRIMLLWGPIIGITIALLGAAVAAAPFLFRARRRWIYWFSLPVGFFALLGGLLMFIGLQNAGKDVRDIFSQLDASIGEPAPDIEFILLGSEPRAANLSHYEGKPVLLNLWATWCGPCLQEMPELSRLAEQHSNDLVVLCLSDEEPNRVQEWLRKHDLTQKIGVFTSPNQIVSPYAAVKAVRPISFVIDRQGIIRDFIIGALSYEGFEKKISGAASRSH